MHGDWGRFCRCAGRTLSEQEFGGANVGTSMLLIRFFEHGGSEWGLFDADGAFLGGPGDGLPEAVRAANARVVALAPGESVLLTQAVVPTRNPARLRRALPYAVEDRLAADVDTLHVAAGPRAAGGAIATAVVARSRLEQWLEALRNAGLEPDAIVPEPLALPLEAGSHTLLFENGRVVARLDTARGFAGEAALLEAVAPDPQCPVVVHEAGEARLPEAWSGSARRQRLPGPALALLAQGAAACPLNLMQGDYPPRRHARGTGRLWRVAAALLLGWGVLELGLSALDAWRLERHSRELQSSIESVFSETFPGARVVDPRAQMAQQLRTLGADRGDALALLRRVAPALQDQPSISLQSAEFRDGVLTLALTASSLAELDSLQAAVAGRPGLRAELGSASASERGVDGRLLVRGSGA